MTRSKEFRRIEAAIKHKDATELRWAEAECKLRLSFSQRERGGRVRGLLKRVQTALEEIDEQS